MGIWVGIVGVVLDRLLKGYAQTIPDGTVFSFFPHLEFGYFLNPALFFFPAWRFIPWLAFVVLTILGSFLILSFKRQAPNSKQYSNSNNQNSKCLGIRISNLFGIWDLGFGISSRYALLPIILGGASNVFDRFAYGGVIDIIHITGLATVNLADILILVGAILLFRRRSA